MPVSNIVIEPLRFQCQCIGFSEWISLFTLCLAPLIAHLISGTPTTSYLTDRRPKWYDRLCSCNPTSIIWRYAAITDRRIRAIQWSRHDLAATNAIFWTSDGWNGGEEMVTTSATYCLRYPESTRVEILSLTMLKTVITTLQGASAFYILVGSVAGVALPGVAIGFGVDTLFFPLSILGLLRLCAAAWLTDDFIYQGDGLRDTSSTETAGPVRQSTMAKYDDIELDHPPRALDPLITMPSETSRFRSPANSWRSRFFRIAFLLVFGGVWIIALFIITPLPALADTYRYTMTTFLLGMFYFAFITISLILYTFYFFRGQTTTTIIPCVSSVWYRLYSLLLTGFMMALIIIASLETNKDPTGIYTSANMGTRFSCVKATRWLVLPQASRWAGLATEWDLGESWLSQNKTSLPVRGLQETGPFAQKEFWLYNFTGYCFGNMNDM